MVRKAQSYGAGYGSLAVNERRLNANTDPETGKARKTNNISNIFSDDMLAARGRGLSANMPYNVCEYCSGEDCIKCTATNVLDIIMGRTYRPKTLDEVCTHDCRSSE